MFGRRNWRAFDPSFAGRQYPFGHPYFDKWYRRPKYNVPINIAEKETEYEITVYASGFDKENVRISVVNDILYISGTRTIDENNPPHFIRQEFPVKSFERVISLNGQVDTKDIKARQENNVLIITLPKSPEAQTPVQDIKVD